MAIRYSKDGDIETYNEATGRKTGHISTMGNDCEQTKEDKEREKKELEEIYKIAGYTPQK